jgi:hypothetical protein
MRNYKKNTPRRLIKAVASLLLIAFIMQFSVFARAGVATPPIASASTTVCGSCPCGSCHPNDCSASIAAVILHHNTGRSLIRNHMENRFELHRQWLIETFFIGNLLPAMMMMTEQLSAVGMYQMLAVGSLMDAKIQLETQRDLQRLQAQAIKDYQPSEDFCWFGTNIRSFSSSERRGKYNKIALNRVSLARQTGQGSSASGISAEADLRSRWENFRRHYCVAFNNAWIEDEASITGMQPACGTSSGSVGARVNADVDYGRLVELPRTIEIDLTGGTNDFTTAAASIAEQDIIALKRNIYGHKPLKSNVGMLEAAAAQKQYLDLRSIAAKRNVAENSFLSIVGMKTMGTANASPSDTFQYLAAIFRGLGIDDVDEIRGLIGEHPSHYAQLELMAKRIYQNQTFYANLYDKPENVVRTSVALRAIELMVDRAMFESRLRKEMAVSVLLSTKLHDGAEKVNADIIRISNAMAQ